MQKHALALGYFALSVFCIFTSAHCFIVFSPLLILGAILALVTGVGYAAEPIAEKLRPVGAWAMKMFRIAQEPPKHSPEQVKPKH